MQNSRIKPPERVAVIGAGMVGLSTAWFLQNYGVDVVIFDRSDVASGASLGNAGWLSPSLVTPLPEPSALKIGFRSVFDPTSPVYIPPTASPKLLRFLLQFSRNCTWPQWRRAMAVLSALNEDALRVFEEIESPDLGVYSEPATPLIAAYRDDVSRRVLVDEFHHIEEAGQHVDFELLSREEVRELEPALSSEIAAGIRINGQRFLNPAKFVKGLGESVSRRGAHIRTNTQVKTIDASENGVLVGGEQFDAVVIASGARMNELARPWGVKCLVQSGRGYSFTIATHCLPKGPIYFPAQRVACSPVDGRLKLVGMMEFRPVDAPLDGRRIVAIKDAVAPLLSGVNVDDRRDEWVGPRPCTSDGLPLIGRTRNRHVFIAGGHGMWGITLGPVTGKLLARQIVTGETPDVLRAVDPLR